MPIHLPALSGSPAQSIELAGMTSPSLKARDHLEKPRLTAPPNDRILLTPWWHHVCIIAAYAATDQIIYAAYSKSWLLTAGLRLSCLLLVPRRFWGALIAGELISTAVVVVPTAHRFGVEWATAALIPPLLYCIPFIYVMQNRIPAFDSEGRTIPSRLLIAALLCALARTLDINMILLALVMRDGSPAMSVTWAGMLEWFLGAYLGALTVTPCVLAIRERLLDQTQPPSWHRMFMPRSMLRGVLMFELPIVASLFLASQFLIGGQNLVYFRIAMLVPVIVLGIRHGWHGAAIGGAVASFFLGATTLDHRDPSLIPTQVMLALVISAWLLWTQRRTPQLRSPEAAHVSAWLAILSLVPMHFLRNAFSPRYAGPDGTLYDAHDRVIAKAAG